jgi:DNA-binding NarL/FixJ family response regulator
MEKIKVAIVDDHLMVRTGLSLILKDNDKTEVVMEAADGKEFLHLLNNHKPDVVLMDINMPVLNGLEATKEALLRRPELKIIALSMHDDEEYIESMIQAGAKGFILKKVGSEELYRAIEIVMAGETYFSQDVMRVLTKKLFTKTTDGEPIVINPREREVLVELCNGLSTLEIADKLCISPRTVESHRAHLLDKTNSKNTISLVLYAIKNKLFVIQKEVV